MPRKHKKIRPSRRTLREQPLTAKVERGRLTITIGIETLAFAYINRPQPSGSKEYMITDADVFAKDTLTSMLHELEDGSSPLTELFDHAGYCAIQDGCTGVEETGRTRL